ncbi:hypothetical protein [Thalassobellus citreus]|uniref:hypothetical protein n=1 Tax=Thalassobellus citreus TaxID=3367752 RepID=UPI0037B73AB9
MMPALIDSNLTESFYIDERGFLYLKISNKNTNYLFTAAELVEYIDIITKTCDKKTNTLLIDVRNFLGEVTFQRPCYLLYAKDLKLKSVCKKVVFITNTAKVNLKIENYISKYKPKVDTKVFNCLEKAIDYCLTP